MSVLQGSLAYTLRSFGRCPYKWEQAFQISVDPMGRLGSRSILVTAVEAGVFRTQPAAWIHRSRRSAARFQSWSRIFGRGSAPARGVDSRRPMRVTDGARGGREEFLESLGPWPELELPGPGTARLP